MCGCIVGVVYCHGYSTGGRDGRRGRNTLLRSDGSEEDLGGKISLPVQPGVSHVTC